eukprot:Hpha_TRINITY_DN24000_c0_g1::TRINITY_DN24000_c0_g1_i1::g.130398::m.130398
MWSCVLRCANLFVRPTDSPEQVRLKRFMTPPCLLFTPLGIAVFLQDLSSGVVSLSIASAMHILSPALLLFSGATNLVTMGNMLDITLLVSATAVLISDLHDASTLSLRGWPFITLTLDVSLFVGRHHVPRSLIFMTLLYVAAERVEATWRLGLYTFGTWGMEGPLELCDCPDPPCAAGFVGLQQASKIVIVVLVDFWFTRAFAVDLEQQLRKMQEVVTVAEEVAASLAKFDIERGESAMVSSNLPPELQTSFKTLLHNLRSYRPYLPQSCLVQGGVEDTEILSVTPTCEDDEQRGFRRLSRQPSCASTDASGRSDSDSAGTNLAQFSVRVAAKRRRASLVCVNRTGYTNGSLEEKLRPAHEEWMESDVEAWCDRVGDHKGVVDFISGDRRYASFNARKTCDNHHAVAIRVVRAQTELQQPLPATGVVVSGNIACGDFGSSTVVRFMIIGSVACNFHALERVAAGWGTRCLVDEATFEAAQFWWHAELLGAVKMVKRNNALILLHRVERPRVQHVDVAEWMYQLTKLSPSPLDGQNEKMKKRIRNMERLRHPGACAETDVECFSSGVLWWLREVGLTQSTAGTPAEAFVDTKASVSDAPAETLSSIGMQGKHLG